MPDLKRICVLLSGLVLCMGMAHAQPVKVVPPAKANSVIWSGVPWFDNKGNIVSAHGANIVKDNGRYYLFGECHYDTSNAFAGFNCYSSTDLGQWTFESIALPVQPEGKLGPNRVGERVKVMKCPGTGEYVMYMHADTLGYKDQFVGYATAKVITGPYTFHGPLLFNGKPIRKWDMGTFQDKDGAGYVLLHGGDIYKLSADYRSVVEQVNKAMTPGFESPAIVHKGGLYYFIGSHLTSWERNDNYYFTASSLAGPWTKRGLIAPEGSLTWNAQTTFVLPIDGDTDTTYMFMGDRWAWPRQASAATYVWQPLEIKDTLLYMPELWDGWTVDTETGTTQRRSKKGRLIANKDAGIVYKGPWKILETDTIEASSSAEKDVTLSVRWKGNRIAMYGIATPNSGYAQVTVRNAKGKVMVSALVDMYCKYTTSSLRFVSPVLPQGNYTIEVKVMGEHGSWTDKSKKTFGSTGNEVSIQQFEVF